MLKKLASTDSINSSSRNLVKGPQLVNAEIKSAMKRIGSSDRNLFRKSAIGEPENLLGKLVEVSAD